MGSRLEENKAIPDIRWDRGERIWERKKGFHVQTAKNKAILLTGGSLSGGKMRNTFLLRVHEFKINKTTEIDKTVGLCFKALYGRLGKGKLV